MIPPLLKHYRKWKYRKGRRLELTIGHDLMVEIEVIDTSRLEAGILVIRHRMLDTWCGKEPGNFSPPFSIAISKLRDLRTYLE